MLGGAPCSKAQPRDTRLSETPTDVGLPESQRPAIDTCFDVEAALKVIQQGLDAIAEGQIPPRAMPPSDMHGRSRLLRGASSTGCVALINSEIHGDPKSLANMQAIVEKLGEYSCSDILFVLENTELPGMNFPPHLAIGRALRIAESQGIQVRQVVRNLAHWEVVEACTCKLEGQMGSSEPLAVLLHVTAQGLKVGHDLLSGVESVRSLLGTRGDNAVADIYSGCKAIGGKTADEVKKVQLAIRESYASACGTDPITPESVDAFLQEAVARGLSYSEALGGLALALAPRSGAYSDVAGHMVNSREQWGDAAPGLFELHCALLAVESEASESPLAFEQKATVALEAMQRAQDEATSAVVRELIAELPNLKAIVFVNGAAHTQSIIDGLKG